MHYYNTTIQYYQLEDKGKEQYHGHFSKDQKYNQLPSKSIPKLSLCIIWHEEQLSHRCDFYPSLCGFYSLLVVHPVWKVLPANIHTCFTFGADADFLKNDIRVKPDLDALGSLGDEGWHCVRGILWAANYELPKTVIASREPVLNDAGVIMAVGASLHWEDGKVATFCCSFLSNLTMDITAIGTKGTLHVHDFIIPHEEKEASFYASSNSGFDDLVTFIVYFKNSMQFLHIEFGDSST
ncbi:hypothetical protein RIF29_41551 [Crotalaria pallida]|uniref:GFO/IDH/MocA-like oxidoreductase domain-containing protein n=1 Tax=Crotalaria pallida TaxID=3830 RepID=A0AAN9E5X7_CROPI